VRARIAPDRLMKITDKPLGRRPANAYTLHGDGSCKPKMVFCIETFRVSMAMRGQSIESESRTTTCSVMPLNDMRGVQSSARE